MPDPATENPTADLANNPNADEVLGLSGSAEIGPEGHKPDPEPTGAATAAPVADDIDEGTPIPEALLQAHPDLAKFKSMEAMAAGYESLQREFHGSRQPDREEPEDQDVDLTPGGDDDGGDLNDPSAFLDQLALRGRALVRSEARDVALEAMRDLRDAEREAQALVARAGDRHGKEFIAANEQLIQAEFIKFPELLSRYPADVAMDKAILLAGLTPPKPGQVSTADADAVRAATVRDMVGTMGETGVTGTGGAGARARGGAVTGATADDVLGLRGGSGLEIRPG
jgi:hypothetical protein